MLWYDLDMHIIIIEIFEHFYQLLYSFKKLNVFMYMATCQNLLGDCQIVLTQIRPRGYKKLFMLNSAEHEIFPAHKC